MDGGIPEENPNGRQAWRVVSKKQADVRRRSPSRKVRNASIVGIEVRVVESTSLRSYPTVIVFNVRGGSFLYGKAMAIFFMYK